MEFTINGFAETANKPNSPKKSLVQVRFPAKNMELTYYNDQFDLQVGDRVYVDGKMEGKPGRVTQICYNFKIKLSDYKRVIAAVDTSVRGCLYMAGSHFLSFDPATLPTAKITAWFKVPAKEEDIIISSTDDRSFRLNDLKSMDVSDTIAERGLTYYQENRVRYICVDGTKGLAIVEGSEGYYSVEFEYHNGEISHLLCDCPCPYTCKHEVASMLQLWETLELIKKHYDDRYTHSGYFAAVCKASLFSFALSGKETGSIEINL